MRIAKKYSQLRLHMTLIYFDGNITGCKEKIISQMFRLCFSFYFQNKLVIVQNMEIQHLINILHSRRHGQIFAIYSHISCLN